MRKYLILLLFLVADIAIVALHLMFGSQNFFLNLDHEQNLPTIYQGTKLIIVSMLAFTTLYLNFGIRKDAKNAGSGKKSGLNDLFIWGIFCLTFLFLAIDELSQFHETFTQRITSGEFTIVNDYLNFFKSLNFTSSTWLVIYIPLFIPFLAYVLVFMKTLWKENRRALVFLVIGAIILFSVPVLEFIGTGTESLRANRYSSLMILEETLEMVGVSFFLYFASLILLKESETLFKASQK
jgi:hypothetical protein